MEKSITLGGWQQQVPLFSKADTLIGHYHHSLSVVDTIGVSKDSVPNHW